MRSRILPVFLLTLALVAVLGGVASAATYTTAGECYACHGATGSGAVSKVDFGVGAVNYTKCTSCHANYPGMGHYHFGYSIGFCTNCHDDEAAFELVPPPGATAVTGYRAPTAFGTYATTTSLSATPAQLHDVHASLGWVESSFGSWGASCSRCHAVASCTACHDEPVAHGEHSTTEYAPVPVRQATGATVATSPSSCMNPACHNPAVSGTSAFIPTCTSCHTVQADPHGYDTADHVAADGDASDIACSACHTLELAAAHGDPGAAGASCATCHPSPRDTLGAWDQSCATGGCHTAASSAPMHAGADVAHSVSTANSLCLECHAGADLGSVHADATDPDSGKTSCFVCHTGVVGQPTTSDCTVCHFTFTDHYATTTHTSSWSLLSCGGAGCHTTTDLAAAHEEHRTEAEGEFGCDGCHGDFSVAAQIEAGLTGCGDCHAGITQTSGHRTAHWPVPPLQDAAGPNYSYYTGSAGTMPTGDCAGCHTSNLVDEHMGLYLDGVVFAPRLDAAGEALSCGTCHDSVDARVLGAIAAGSATCESCHDVHGPMQDVHASTFVDDPAVPCAGCHDADIANEHNGGYTSSAGLTGCDVCHALFSTTGEMGVTVQNAIAVTDDTRCTACHASYHTNTASHDASTAASLACGTCHAKGQSVIDVTAVHAGAEAGACDVCHASARIGEISGLTAECVSCHADEGTDYHLNMAVHDAPDNAACGVSGCHHSGSDVTVFHDGCATCHDGTVDLAGKTTACVNCHATEGVDYHFAFDAKHEPADAASTDCSGCHDTTDVTALHVTQGCNTCHFQQGCTDCHSGMVLHKTTACAQCHSTEGTDYHTDMAAGHTFGTMDPSCTAAGCHVADTLPEEHERFLAGSGYDTTCDLCHENTDPGRIDWTSASADCSSCHEVHGDIGVIHTAIASQTCVDCHATGDVRDLHGASPAASCAVCHAAPAGRIDWDTATVECASCHGGLVPVDPNHYPAASHLTSHETVCTDCHFQDLKTEHAKASIDVSCTECHQTDAGIIAAGWNLTCAECHGDMHDDKVSRHASVRSDCSTSGCHSSDVSAIHSKLPQMGCRSCHTSPGKLATDLTKNCTDAGCHVAYHDRLPGLHTATASSACTGCHPEALADGSQLVPVHQGQCATCHNAAVDPATKTAECASCHAVAGTDYHALMNGKHTFSAMGASCTQAGCHTKTLPEEHAKYLTRYPVYADSCALCHANTNPARIDWATASADCATCHEVHGDIAAVHATTGSQACVACHETGDVRQLHGTSAETSCAVCHSAAAGRINWATATVECASCHGTLAPVDPNHYPTAAHDASAETACNQCHLKDMKAEHFKPTVGVGCVQCHESKVDALTAPWNKTCAACHPTNHGDRQARHTSTTTGCAGSGCHIITDVAALHDVAGGPGCGACHASATAPATTTACTASGCHASVGSNHHEAHNAAATNAGGCNGCHVMYLDDEHAALGFTCDTCHASTAAQAVKTAIAAGDLRCKSCHPTMHSRQDWEFNPGRASVHRVSADLPGMRSSFVVNGTTYNWSLPSASTFLKTGWTTNSMMGCVDCHTYSGATGPHGSAMKVNIDPAYPKPYKATTGSSSSTAQLSPNSPTGMSMSDSGSSPAGIICEKCHDLNGTGSSFSNVVHSEHDDRGSEGGYCTYCHVSLPHGWSRPRMLGYTTDAAPYATYRGGISRIALKSYTPNGWSKSDCGASCSSSRHPSSGTSWPATDVAPPVPTTGSVSGTVTSSANAAAIAGATVSVGGKTATTASNGTYTAADVTAGTYTMTVSASGFTTWSGSVTVSAGSTLAKSLTLTPAPVATTGAINGVVTKAGTSVLVSGASVTVGAKTATTSTGGAYSIADVTAGTYTMTVTATGYTTWTAPVTISAGSTTVCNVALTPVPVVPTATNIGRTGTASASSQYSSSYSAAKANDGSTSTYWRSGSGGTQWLRVDLGSTKTVEKVVVNWYDTRYARAFSIQTSTDGSNWTTRYSTSSGTSGIKTITFTPVSARYVRVYCTTTNDSNYRVREFEVWGY